MKEGIPLVIDVQRRDKKSIDLSEIIDAAHTNGLVGVKYSDYRFEITGNKLKVTPLYNPT